MTKTSIVPAAGPERHQLPGLAGNNILNWSVLDDGTVKQSPSDFLFFQKLSFSNIFFPQLLMTSLKPSYNLFLLWPNRGSQRAHTHTPTSGSFIFSMVIRRREVWLESVCSQLLTSCRHGCRGIISSQYLRGENRASKGGSKAAGLIIFSFQKDRLHAWRLCVSYLEIWRKNSDIKFFQFRLQHFFTHSSSPDGASELQLPACTNPSNSASFFIGLFEGVNIHRNYQTCRQADWIVHRRLPYCGSWLEGGSL